MTMKTWWPACVLLCLILIGCGPNPEKEAQYQRNREKSMQEYREKALALVKKGDCIMAWESVHGFERVEDGCIAAGFDVRKIRDDFKTVLREALREDIVKLAAAAEKSSSAEAAFSNLISFVAPSDLREALKEAKKEVIVREQKLIPGTILVKVNSLLGTGMEKYQSDLGKHFLKFFQNVYKPIPVKLAPSETDENEGDYLSCIEVMLGGDAEIYGHFAEFNLPVSLFCSIHVPKKIRLWDRSDYSAYEKKFPPAKVDRMRKYPNYDILRKKLFASLEKQFPVPDAVEALAKEAEKRIADGVPRIDRYFQCKVTGEAKGIILDEVVFRGLQERFGGAIRRGEVENPLGTLEVTIAATYAVDDSAGIMAIREIESKKSVDTLAVAVVKVESVAGVSSNWDGEHTFKARFSPPEKTRRSEEELLGRSVCQTAVGLREEILKKPKLKLAPVRKDETKPATE